MSDLLRDCHEYYAIPGNEAGGNLHIALADGNMEWDHVEFCKQECSEAKDMDGYLLCLRLLQLTEDERFALYEQFWKRPQYLSYAGDEL